MFASWFYLWSDSAANKGLHFLDGILFVFFLIWFVLGVNYDCKGDD